ncbi:MAG: PorT family protein [Bacteroidales bacterium]|nr:PorT family protein [Bacteroidales bacterium]
MKKAGLLFVLALFVSSLSAQIITDKTSKKFTVGFDFYTDILTQTPVDYDARTINQGFNVFGTYNFALGKSPHTFSLGLGIRSQNLYSNTAIADLNADTISFVPITNNYKRSKINLVYLDFPAELRFKFDNKWKLGVGFKFGIVIDSKTKYVGDITAIGPRVHHKSKKINSLEKYTYGPTFRLGYKWFSVFAYYQPARVFKRDLGPEFYPLSVGVTLSPF